MAVDKREMLAIHEGEFEAWGRLLARLSPTQLTDPSLPAGQSVKDTLAHLGAWQGRTIARLEAALHDHEPRFPPWPMEVSDEETSDEVDRANAWILETNRKLSWEAVYQGWRTAFLRLLELLRSIPAADLRPGGKLSWMAEYELLDGYTDVYDCHHSEHRSQLEAWLRDQAAE
jgi:hypothetical protein